MQDRFKFRFFETYNNTMLDCKDYEFNERKAVEEWVKHIKLKTS